MAGKQTTAGRAFVGALVLLVAAAVGGCGDSEPAISSDQLESALGENLDIPGSEAGRSYEVACTLDDGDGINDPWTCEVEASPGVTLSGVSSDVTAFTLTAWIADDGSFAAVQTAGEGVFEGGGATGSFGCCVEDEDLDQ